MATSLASPPPTSSTTGSAAGAARLRAVEDVIGQGYSYGLGLVRSGEWMLQNPMFDGKGGAFAYLPSQQIAIAVVVTFDAAAFDPVTSTTIRGNT